MTDNTSDRPDTATEMGMFEDRQRPYDPDVLAARRPATEAEQAVERARADERSRWITALGVLAGRYNMRWFARELRAALDGPARDRDIP